MSKNAEKTLINYCLDTENFLVLIKKLIRMAIFEAPSSAIKGKEIIKKKKRLKNAETTRVEQNPCSGQFYFSSISFSIFFFTAINFFSYLVCIVS